MTRIDFYILEDPAPDARLKFVCRLVEKAWQQGLRIYIHAGDEAEARRLDDLLWTFRGGSFIPHGCLDSAIDPDARVHIGCTEPPEGHDTLMINLADGVPSCFSRFERLAEVVDRDEERRRQGRERFRFYRDRGYPLESHTLKAE